jgi:ATP-independent RNA helicase DbpA
VSIPTNNKFDVLGLSSETLTNLSSLGYHEMTPIQAQSLPPILAGNDVIAQSKTGSGKTAAFGLGVLNKLNVKRFRVQTLILCPTRELADQVSKELRRLARATHNIKILTLCGGTAFGPQVGSLEHGAHIIVGTPGRIEEHLRKGKLNLEELTTFVLDEADRMLDMGFKDTIDAILLHIPPQRQTLLFSATFPREIEAMTSNIMSNPIRIENKDTHNKDSIQQYVCKLEDETDRITALRLILLQFTPESTLIFCNTRKQVQEVANELIAANFNALALHGELEQRSRDEILVRFSNKSASILVATDVAARGLDIDELDLVINHQIAPELEVHVHRVGRTGRAGKKGQAFTLYTAREQHRLTNLEKFLGHSIEPYELPNEALLDKPTFYPAMATLQIDGGKKQKIRPGDILGALTGDDGIAGADVGKINVFDRSTYVAVTQAAAKAALTKLSEGKLKGRSFRVRRIRG